MSVAIKAVTSVFDFENLFISYNASLSIEDQTTADLEKTKLINLKNILKCYSVTKTYLQLWNKHCIDWSYQNNVKTGRHSSVIRV